MKQKCLSNILFKHSFLNTALGLAHIDIGYSYGTGLINDRISGSPGHHNNTKMVTSQLDVLPELELGQTTRVYITVTS